MPLYNVSFLTYKKYSRQTFIKKKTTSRLEQKICVILYAFLHRLKKFFRLINNINNIIRIKKNFSASFTHRLNDRNREINLKKKN